MAWSVVQSASHATNAFVGSISVTVGSALSSGTKLIVGVNIYGTGVAPSSVSDGTNSFTKVADTGVPSGVGNGGSQLWVLDTPAGDVGTTPTITATYSGSGSGESVIIVQEVSGLASGTTGSLDGTAGTLANFTGSGAHGTPVNTGTPTYSSSALNEYLLSFNTFYTNNNVAVNDVGSASALTEDANNVDANQIGILGGFAYGNSTNGAETDGWSINPGRASGEFIAWGTIFVAFKLAAGASVSGTVQPLATRQPRRKSARGLWGGVRGPAFVAVAAPPRLPPVPRRTAARAVWAGSKPFTGFVAVAAPPLEFHAPRRTAARGVWGGIHGQAFVAVAAPPLLRPIPRRYPARAVWHGSAPFTGFVSVAAPPRLPPVPRRYPARAVIQFTPVTTTNATSHVAGALPVLTVNRTEVMSRVTGRVVRR